MANMDAIAMLYGWDFEPLMRNGKAVDDGIDAYKYMATDRNGYVYAYPSKPYLEDGLWSTDYDWEVQIRHIGKSTINYEESLRYIGN